MFIVILSWGNNAYILFKKIQQNKKIEIKKWMWTPTVHPPPIAKSLTSISAVSFLLYLQIWIFLKGIFACQHTESCLIIFKAVS